MKPRVPPVDLGESSAMQDAAGSLDPLEINNANDNYTNRITLECKVAVLKYGKFQIYI